MPKRHNLSGNLNDLVRSAREFVAWARSLGVPLKLNNNWIEKAIVRTEQLLSERDDNKRRQLFDKLYNDPVESQYNLSDLMLLTFIKEYIGNQDRTILRKKLSLATRGADSAHQETAGNTAARDALFELAFCARLNERLFKAMLTDPNPDITAKRKKVTVAIECKRIFSGARLDKLIKEAVAQLRDRPKNREADLRVAACNVTRYLTQGKLHLQGTVIEAQNHLLNEMKKIATQVAELIEREQLKDVDAIVLTYMDYVEVSESGYTLTNISQHSVVINHRTTAKRRRKANRLLSKLGPPNPNPNDDNLYIFS